MQTPNHRVRLLGNAPKRNDTLHAVLVVPTLTLTVAPSLTLTLILMERAPTP